MSKARILYVEDDAALAFVTKDNLEDLGYEVVHCADGELGLASFKNGNFDLCLLDVMLPRMDGFSLGKKIRERDSEIPILFLTAKGMESDRLEGFELGGDDYIVKPFSMAELEKRIQVFLRRSGKSGDSEFLFQGGKLDVDGMKLFLNEEVVDLTRKEAEVLGLFFKRAGQALSREEILSQVWGKSDYFSGRSLDVYISKLRKYLKPIEEISIETLHGKGFKLIVSEEEKE